MKKFFSPVIRRSSSSSNATSTNVASTSKSANALPQSQSEPNVDVLPPQSESMKRIFTPVIRRSSSSSNAISILVKMVKRGGGYLRSKSFEIPSIDFAVERAQRFSSTDILSFTSNFAIKIGSDAFGDVYKGQFPNGVEVAVNVPIRSDVGEMIFMSQISTFSRTYHRNLIKIYGFCFEGDVKAIVYEYMKNGSLDSILYENDNGIDCAMFYRIGLGIARGIAYLHHGCDKQIIHHHLIPTNVLLDENLSPKVVNFGMSELFKKKTSPGHFTAPEMYIPDSRTTTKCDVYSFGMILFEIVRAIGVGCWFQEIVLDEFENSDKRKARVLSMVALWCVHFTPHSRPSMSSVVTVLEKEILVNMPPNPFLPTDPLKSIMQPLQESKEIFSSRADVLEKVKGMKEQQSIQRSNASVYQVAMLNHELVFEKAKRYSSDELATFTSNFDNEIGFGAFGTVYKGQLSDATEIAVKVLKMHDFVQQSFLTEIRTLGKTGHQNLIKLFGFCLEENMLALVYEYMENGSLDMILYKKPLTIEWSKLYAIAVEIATALAYLHYDCEDQIIHHDIKASNVLLDSNHLPKLADFGLANIKDSERTHLTMSKMKGTPCYAAPEIWIPLSPITYKCDVYGFGMILFEILGTERNTHTDIWFPGHVWEKFNSGKLDDVLVDRGIIEKDRKKATILSMVALWCAQFTPQIRPSMRTVVTVLQNEIPVNRPPNPLLSSDSSTLMQPAQNS